MTDANDMELVREYAYKQLDSAFEKLVSRHIGMVYSAALRRSGNPAHAEEITQAVFVILARKAARLPTSTILVAWLHETTRLAAASFLRSEFRRHRREQEAYMQSTLSESAPDPWQQLAPLLDEAIGQLGDKDRNAVVLRFFQNKSSREIAAALHVDESAAQKRLNRAVEKLRAYFLKRGVAVSAGVLISVISVNSVQGAPLHLTTSVLAAVPQDAVGGTTLTIIKGALKLMAWNKAKIAAVAALGLLLAAGTATVSVKEVASYRNESLWRTPNFKSDVFNQVPPQVRILPAKFPEIQRNYGDLDGRRIGIGCPAYLIVCFAYDWLPARIVFADGEPQKKYDYIANLPIGSMEALQHELKNALGVVGRPETRDEDVLLLKVRTPNAPGLKPPTGVPDASAGTGQIYYHNLPLATSHLSSFSLAAELEYRFGLPVVDETGLTQKFNIDLKWNERGEQDPNHDALRHALLDQLGLELVPGQAPVEMLVMERAPH